MREIKFRAWDGRKQRMMVVDLVAWFNNKPHKVNVLWDVKIDEVELMQFTGLKDKNGKEIYEGDIVEVYGSYLGKNHKEVIFTDICAYNVDEAKYIFEGKKSDFGCEHSWGNAYRVIGNIYENPELLSNQKMTAIVDQIADVVGRTTLHYEYKQKFIDPLKLAEWIGEEKQKSFEAGQDEERESIKKLIDQCTDPDFGTIDYDELAELILEKYS